ncbi:MAG: DEAD/DEAH box helicase [Candidatus Nanoarchaeia archaeon]|nr:DEAD/DEAH box helicase [Candidatus Nanoarchaeia archaeon]
MEFKELGISSGLSDELKNHGIVVPTTVQIKSIPLILNKKDVLIQSETGSGKTIGFAVPTIDMVKPVKNVQVLVVTPTRELAKQVSEEYVKFSRKKGLNISVVYGGVSINEQFRHIKTADIVVGTPGRLLDLLERRMLNLTYTNYFILDEADRLMDMGFIDDINRIISHLPNQKQSLMFSATINKEISRLAENYLKNPEKILLENILKKGVLKQYYYAVKEYNKISLLVHLLRDINREKTIVFTNTKRKTDFIASILKKQGFRAESINGDMSQNMREKVMKNFATGRTGVLVATDVAARGLHIEDITHIFNYDLPNTAETYTHRIGRTARNGKKGIAISFCAMQDEDNMCSILDVYEDKLEEKTVPQIEKIKVEFNRCQNRDRFQRGGRRGNRFGENRRNTHNRNTHNSGRRNGFCRVFD